MAEPQISWQSTPTGGSGTALPSFRWVRWLVACLILLTLALAAHTKGRFARVTLVDTRHWMTTTTRLPAHLTGVRGSVLSRVLPTAAVFKAHAPGWMAPLHHARLVQGYGWHGTGSHAVFRAVVALGVQKNTPVLAATQARVLRVTARSITLVAQNKDDIQWTGIKPGPLKVGSRLQPSQVVGRAAATQIHIEVTKDGYPVNPLSSTLYGKSWLQR